MHTLRSALSVLPSSVCEGDIDPKVQRQLTLRRICMSGGRAVSHHPYYTVSAVDEDQYDDAIWLTSRVLGVTDVGVWVTGEDC